MHHLWRSTRHDDDNRQQRMNAKQQEEEEMLNRSRQTHYFDGQRIRTNDEDSISNGTPEFPRG